MNRTLAWTAGMLGLSGSLLGAASLSTPFVDVQVENVQPGKVFSVKHSAAEGLALNNLSDAPLRVRIAVLIPSETELRDGAKPIPDTHWVRIEPAEVAIPPQQRAVCRVTLHVPEGRRFRGKYYQASIWSRSEPMQGTQVAFSAGLLSRLRFKTK